MHSYFSESDISKIYNSIILLDVDGTILFDGTATCSDDIKKQISVLKQQNNEIYLCSNNKKGTRLTELAQILQVNALETPLRKPHPRISRLLSKDKPLVVIGDKLLTDGLFALFAGAPFVKVKHLWSKDDRFSVKILYGIETVLYNLLTFAQKIARFFNISILF